MERNFMAKKDNDGLFNDFFNQMKKVKLSPDRQNLKPVDPSLTFEQYLAIAIKEGEALLAAEEKAKAKSSVKPEPLAQPSAKLQEALAKMSDNPYVRARIEILNKMGPTARSVIEKMEKGDIPKDGRYDTFCKAINARGEQIYLSSKKN
jgi:hypothetical protein